MCEQCEQNKKNIKKFAVMDLSGCMVTEKSRDRIDGHCSSCEHPVIKVICSSIGANHEDIRYTDDNTIWGLRLCPNCYSNISENWVRNDPGKVISINKDKNYV